MFNQFVVSPLAFHAQGILSESEKTAIVGGANGYDYISQKRRKAK